MDHHKLIEQRGEEPVFLPGHMGESWQKVDFGLGASTLRSSPEVLAGLPPQDRHWGRMFGYAVAGGLGALALVLALRALLGR